MTAAGNAIVDEVAHAKDNGMAIQDGIWGPEDLEESRHSSRHCSLEYEEEIHG